MKEKVTIFFIIILFVVNTSLCIGSADNNGGGNTKPVSSSTPTSTEVIVGSWGKSDSSADMPGTFVFNADHTFNCPGFGIYGTWRKDDGVLANRYLFTITGSDQWTPFKFNIEFYALYNGQSSSTVQYANQKVITSGEFLNIQSLREGFNPTGWSQYAKAGTFKTQTIYTGG